MLELLQDQGLGIKHLLVVVLNDRFAHVQNAVAELEEGSFVSRWDVRGGRRTAVRRVTHAKHVDVQVIKRTVAARLL